MRKRIPPVTRTPPDHAQRLRLETEFATNLLVEAGAGAGKTESLARRMAAGVAAGHYAVDHLAAVTFTRKAAAELRARFLQKLEERLAVTAVTDERERLQAAVDGIERFFAGTIHSFCARMLRERPVDARMAPDFEELDDVADAHARLRAWHDYIARGRSNAALLDVLDSGLKPKELTDAFRIVCEHGDVEFATTPVDLPDPAPVWAALDRFWEALEAELPADIDPNTTCEVQKLARTYPGMRRGARTHRVADLVALLQEWARTKKIVLKWWGNGQSRGNPGADRARALVDPFLEGIVTPFLGIWRAHLYALVVRALIEARDHYAADRRQRNLVSFGDLLVEATRLVRDVPHVRHALQRKFRHVFVDEFQDTDPIQAELFLWLAAVEDAPPGVTAWTVALRPGALFLVGDPKQSIYRFRRADIEVYESVRRRLVEAGGEVVPLTANFRSRPELCAFVNATCAPAFPPAPTPEAPAYEPLRAHREADASQGPAVERLIVAASPGEEQADAEARCIADLVAVEIAAGLGRPSDYLVLTRGRPRLGAYAEALQARLVAVEVSGASLFTASPSVHALVDVLAALADPSDGVALLRVLRGPILGVTDDALYAYRRAGGRFDLHAPVGVDDEVARAVAILRGWQRQARRLPVGALIDTVLEESGWLAQAAAHPGGGEAGALLQAADRARAMAVSGAGLHDIAAALVDEEDVSTDIEALPLEPGRADVVRVMNIHRAKGLEARVVFLADAQSWHSFAPEVRVSRLEGRARGVLAISRPAKPQGRVMLAHPDTWPAMAQREQQFLAAEVTRLQYVAATRAKDRLILVRSGAGARDDKAWPLVAAAAGAVPDVQWPSRRAVAPSSPASLLDLMAAAPEDAAAAARSRDERTARARRPSFAVTSVTDEVRLASAALRSPLHEDDGDGDGDATATLVPDTTGHRADTGRHWGALIHGLLEQAMRAPATTADDLARLARWLTVETPELRAHIPQAVSLVQGVASAPFWAEARSHGDVHVEVPFTRLATPGDLDTLAAEPSETPTLLRGVIDLVHRAGEGWRVVDYKTDQARAADLAAKYAAQVTVYAAAWSEAAGGRPVGAAVYAVRDGKLMPVVLPV
jgi:ATP-dependent helicase/nuclease subunit A